MITRTERRIDMSRPGFSLIEITAVILLIGILAAGAAIAILPQVARAKVNATRNSMNTIKTAINSYMVEHSQAPQSLQELIPDYLEQGSDMDAWKTGYYYALTPGGQHPYILYSAGPDKDMTTADDNLDLWTLDLQE